MRGEHPPSTRISSPWLRQSGCTCFLRVPVTATISLCSATAGYRGCGDGGGWQATCGGMAVGMVVVVGGRGGEAAGFDDDGNEHDDGRDIHDYDQSC